MYSVQDYVMGTVVILVIVIVILPVASFLITRIGSFGYFKSKQEYLENLINKKDKEEKK